MKFSEVIGQSELKEKLIQSVKDNRVSHAQLFYGPSGTGKLALALSYAQYVACTDKQDNDSCGVCNSCKKYSKLIHPDLHFVFPVVTQKGKQSTSDSFISQWREKVVGNAYFTYESWLETINAENKQGSIYKDEAKEILRKLNLKTFESEFKVMIIWLPEKMNATAANKLLKIIEEPPQKTLFILISEHREEVLPTISSRTQPVKVRRLTNDEIATALNKREGIDLENALSISKLAGGSYIQALYHVKASESRTAHFNYFVKLMRLAYRRNVPELLDLAKEITDDGREKQKAFLSFCLKMIRENFILNNKVPELNMLLDHEQDFAKNFSKFITQSNVYKITEEIELAYYHISRNVSSRLVLTDLFFTIMQLLRVTE
jgi:DNA polymerase III subunit delta'